MGPTLALLLILIAGMLLAGWSVRSRDVRLARLTRAARELAQGKLDTRPIPEGPLAIRTLALAMNEASDMVEKRVTGLEGERNLYAEVIRGIQEGLLVVDRQQKVLLANPAAAELLDSDFERASGTALWEVLRNEPVIEAFREVVHSGKPRTIQIGPIKERHLTLAYSPLASQDRLALVIHDTTESARYQELRKEFVANVSHELRTPLTIIRGFVETLEDGAIHDPARAAEFLSFISKHSRQLSNLVENLLDLSRLESSQALRRRIRVDLGAILSRVIDLQSPSAKKKGQSLNLETPPYLPPVLGDPDYLERAVSNLVDNAVKYTPDGGAISVSAEEDRKSVVVQVKDTGIGIPDSDLPRIFERFYRVDKSRSRDMGGTGLGLAIVKHVVQAHGGTIEASSKLGEGATFRMALPTGVEG